MVAGKTLELDGFSLELEDVSAVANGNGLRVLLHPDSLKKLDATRAYIEKNWLTDEAPLIYSFNTGVGNLKNTRIPAREIGRFQRNIIRAHAAGCGEPL